MLLGFVQMHISYGIGSPWGVVTAPTGLESTPAAHELAGSLEAAPPWSPLIGAEKTCCVAMDAWASCLASPRLVGLAHRTGDGEQPCP